MFTSWSADESEVKPLSAREWNQLEEKLRAQNADVADLTGSTTEKIIQILQTSAGEQLRLRGRWTGPL